MTHNYEYPRPAYTADTVVFNGASVLLIRRGKEPFKGKLALPGGFVNEGEQSIDAAKRELGEETGPIVCSPFKLVGIYDSRGRDPRGWVVSAAYRTRTKQLHVRAGDDADDAFFVPLNKLGKELLSFDHWTVINDAWEQEGKERELKMLPNIKFYAQVKDVFPSQEFADIFNGLRKPIDSNAKKDPLFLEKARSEYDLHFTVNALEMVI